MSTSRGEVLYDDWRARRQSGRFAHDFLARTIGQLLGQLKLTFVERARPLVAPVVLLGWVIVFAMAVPFWRDLQQQAAERTLGEEFDARIYAARPRGISVALRNVDELRLARATRLLNRLDELALNLSNTRIASLEPLRGLTSLLSLDLTSTGITDLQPLTGLTSLSSLNLTLDEGITSLEPLRGSESAHQTRTWTDGVSATTFTCRVLWPGCPHVPEASAPGRHQSAWWGRLQIGSGGRDPIVTVGDIIGIRTQAAAAAAERHSR